ARRADARRPRTRRRSQRWPRGRAPRRRWARPRARSVPYEAVPVDEPRRTQPTRARTFVRLLGFLRPYRASLAVSSVLAIASQVTGILVPVLTGAVINELSGGASTRILALLVGAIVLLGLIRGGLMYGRRVISGRQALAVEYDLRDELYSHFLRLSF